MTKDEALRIALEALENAPIEYDFHGNPMDAEFGKQLDAAIAALRQALEETQTPDDLLRQSEREGWRYAKECEAEVKRLRQALEQPEYEFELQNYVLCDRCNQIVNKEFERLQQEQFFYKQTQNVPPAPNGENT